MFHSLKPENQELQVRAGAPVELRDPAQVTFNHRWSLHAIQKPADPPPAPEPLWYG